MRILHFLGTIWRLNTFFEVFVVEPFPWGQLARIADVDSWYGHSVECVGLHHGIDGHIAENDFIAFVYRLVKTIGADDVT